MVNPRLVELHLPWKGYNPEFIFLLNQVIVEPDTHEPQMLIKQLHPMAETLDDRTVRLHCRNIGIIEGTEFVIALPNWDKPEGGGTGIGIKVAEHFGIRIFDSAKRKTANVSWPRSKINLNPELLVLSHRAYVKVRGFFIRQIQQAEGYEPDSPADYPRSIAVQLIPKKNLATTGRWPVPTSCNNRQAN